MHRLLPMFLIVALMGCQENEKEIVEEEKIEVIQEVHPSDEILPVEPVAEDKEEWGNGIVVRFQGMSIFMESFDVSWETKNWGTGDMDTDEFMYDVKGDTAIMDLMPGDWMLGKRFKILPENVPTVELYQQEIIHVAIDSDRMMEVPFCVLSGWLEYKTDWQQVPLNKGINTFPDQLDESEIELDFTLEEFMDGVETECGEDWREEYAKYSTIEEVPYTYFSSSILYKFVLRSGDVEIVKYLMFDTPISC